MYLTIPFAILMSLSAATQGNNIDSLKSLLKMGKQDTTHVLSLFHLSVELQRSNVDSAFLLAQQGIELAKEIDYERGELLCKTCISRCFWSIGDYNNAIKIVLEETNELKRVTI